MSSFTDVFSINSVPMLAPDGKEADMYVNT